MFDVYDPKLKGALPIRKFLLEIYTLYKFFAMENNISHCLGEFVTVVILHNNNLGVGMYLNWFLIVSP